MANQSTFAAPKKADNWSAEAGFGLCVGQASYAPGQVIVASSVLSLTNPDLSKQAHAILMCEARDFLLIFNLAASNRIKLQININGTGWSAAGAGGGSLAVGQYLEMGCETVVRTLAIPPGGTITAEARVIYNGTLGNSAGGCLTLNLFGAL